MPSPDNNTLVRLTDVALFYERRQVLADVNLTVSDRDFIVVTGVNGGGKTTMLRVLLKLLPPTSGRVTYYDHGKEVNALRIGYLPQKTAIDSSFPISVEEVIRSGLYSPDKSLQNTCNEKERVDAVMAELELTALAQRPIGELSGGQLQRTLLARAIVSSPQLLVLDEPLSYIDELFAPRIYDMLSRLSSHTAIIMVTHRPAAVSSMATQVVRIENGKLLR